MINQERSAIIIVNSIPHYCYELNNVLALPKSFEYRFRYQKGTTSDWLPTIEDPRSLEKSRALIVIRIWDTAEFIPLRWVQITNVRKVGDVVYFNYELGEIIGLNHEADNHRKQLDKFNNHIENAIGNYENNPGEDLQNLIFFAPDFTYSIASSEQDEIEKWGNMVSILGELDVYEDFDFYKILDLESEGKTIPAEDGKFRLLSGKEYSLQIFRRSFLNRLGDSSVAATRQVQLKSGSGLRTIISNQFVRGKYDMMEFKFQVKPTSTSNNSFIIIRTERESDDIEVPDIQIPVDMRPSLEQKSILIGSITGFVLGASLMFIPDNIIFWTDLSPGMIDVVRNSAIILMILSATRFSQLKDALPNILRGY